MLTRVNGVTELRDSRRTDGACHRATKHAQQRSPDDLQHRDLHRSADTGGAPQQGIGKIVPLPGLTVLQLLHITSKYQGRTHGGARAHPRGAEVPLGSEKHYIFGVSSVKLRDLHL